MPINSAWRLMPSAWPAAIIALRSAGRPCRARRTKKSISSALLADLGVQGLEVRPGFLRARRLRAEHAGGALEQLLLPIRNLVGVHVVQLRQLGQRLLASHGV